MNEHATAGVSRLFRTFGPEFLANRRLLGLAYSSRLLAIAASLLTPWPLKLIIDNVATGKSLPQPFGSWLSGVSGEGVVVLLAITYLAFNGIDAIAGAAEKNYNARVRERLTSALRDRLLGHLQTLPPTIRTGHRSGELVLRIVSDVDLFVRVQTKTLATVFENLTTVLLTLVVMFWVHTGVALVSLLLLPIVFFVLRYYARRLASASRIKRRHEGSVSALAQEIVRGLAVIQAHGTGPLVRERFGRTNALRLKAGVEETRVAVAMQRTLEVTRGLAVGLVIGVGGLLVLRQQLTLGELTVLSAYVLQLLKPVEKLNDLAETAARGIAGGERLLALLALEPAVHDAPGALDLGRARGLLEFEHVSFAYPGEDDQLISVLKGADLVLRPGEFAVLVGPSGAGKSTLLSLIVRLFDPASGTISLDGYPLQQVALKSLRSQVAIMTQDTHLFAGTLRSVLTPPAQTINERRLWEALELVALDDFVRSLPQGLDLPLGEDGLNLSGGQRTRVSLARAFLLDRPILLLDEPLANIDAISEAVILDALRRVRIGRTCLAVTHNLSLLSLADSVYRLQDGRIVADDGVVEARPRLHVVHAR